MTASELLSKKAYELGIDEALFQKKGLVSVRQYENLIFTSGTGAADFRQGKVGDELTFEDGYLACQHIALIQISALRDYLGILDRVEQILRVYAHLTVADDFHDLDKMADGFSDVFGYVFRDAGKSPRTLLGCRNLPVGNTAAEFELIAAIRG